MTHLKINNVTIRYTVRGGARLGGTNVVGGKLIDGPKGRYVEALSSVNLDFADGDRIGVIGLNGSEKARFFRSPLGYWRLTAERCRSTERSRPCSQVRSE